MCSIVNLALAAGAGRKAWINAVWLAAEKSVG